PDVGDDGERLVAEGEVTGEWVVEPLGAGAVLADVVGGPAHSELVATHGELTDEVRQFAVIGISAGFGAERPDRGVGDAVPVDVEAPGPRVQEDEPGQVHRPGRVDEGLGVEGIAEPIGGEYVEAPVADEGGGVRDGVEDLLHAGADLLGGGPAAGGSLLGSVDEVEEMGPFHLVELEGAGDRLEDVVGDASDGAAFELDVVLDADPGEQCHLLAAQARDAAAATVGPQTRLLGSDSGPPRGQEGADLVPSGHGVHGRSDTRSEGGAASTPIDVISLVAAGGLSMGSMPATILNDPEPMEA